MEYIAIGWVILVLFWICLGGLFLKGIIYPVVVHVVKAVQGVTG